MGGIKTTTGLSGTYLFGAGYTANTSGTTTTFTLTNTMSVQVTSANAASVIATIASTYPYTCKNTTGRCTNTNLYKIDSFASGTTANVYRSTYRDAIGITKFSTNVNSVGDVGYMYNTRYAASQTQISQEVTMLSGVTLDSNNLTIYENYYFGDSYAMSGNNHVLNNSVKGNAISDYPSSWVGKYMCESNSSSVLTPKFLA